MQLIRLCMGVLEENALAFKRQHGSEASNTVIDVGVACIIGTSLASK